jgi:hypothetical protein
MKQLIAVLALVIAPSLARADPPTPPEIKVLSAGKAPTKQLRFEAKQGAKVTMEFVETSAMARGAKGKVPALEPTPTVRTTLDFDISDVQANGDFRIDLVYRKIEADTAKVKPELARRINTQLAVMAGAKGHAVVTARGVTKETDLEIPASATPELRQGLETLRALQGQIVSAFPEDPVGAGARWETRKTVQADDGSGGLVVQQTASYELVALAGTRGKLAITLNQSGKSNDGKLTTSTRGKGEIAFDLAQIGVGSSRIEIRTEVTLDDGGMHLVRVNTTTTTFTGRAR